jgi:hypothetical protein
MLLACLFLVCSALTGCLNVRAPDVQINMRPPPEQIDSSRVPPTATHQEARAELVKAYKHIRYLEQHNARLRDKAADAREKRDEYKRKYKRLKERDDH